MRRYCVRLAVYRGIVAEARRRATVMQRKKAVGQSVGQWCVWVSGRCWARAATWAAMLPTTTQQAAALGKEDMVFKTVDMWYRRLVRA